MRIPSNMTESEVLSVFDEVINKLAYKFKFGSYEIDDVKQEGMIAAIKGLENYDEKLPLANFIYIHVKNRLYNFKRDHYVRLEKPCVRCPLKAFLPPDGCLEFEDRMDCSLYSNWLGRNTIKRNLTHTLEYGQVNAVSEKNMGYGDEMIENINSNEILDIIDQELPIELRKNYLKMLAGERIPKKDRMIVEDMVIKIIKQNKYEI